MKGLICWLACRGAVTAGWPFLPAYFRADDALQIPNLLLQFPHLLPHFRLRVGGLPRVPDLRTLCRVPTPVVFILSGQRADPLWLHTARCAWWPCFNDNPGCCPRGVAMP